MNTSLVLMEKLLSMMLVAAVGFFTIRIGLLEERDTRQLAKLSIYVLSPCLIISAFRVDLTAEKLRGYLAAFVFALLVQGCFIVLAGALGRGRLIGVPEELSIVYTNCGNLILPVISMAMGPQMVFYGSAYQLAFNFLFWTHGICRMQDTRRIDWKRVLLNPNILAIFAGILVLVTGLPAPAPVNTAMDMLAAMVGPCSMLVIGMTLARIRLIRLFTMKRAYGILFLRLIAFPLLALGALFASGFPARHPELIPVFRISFLAIAAPPAANVAQLAVLYDREPVNTGICNMLGTLFSVLTIPLVDYLFTLAFSVA